MASRKTQSPLEKEMMIAEIARQYLMGIQQIKIAESVGIKPPAVTYHLQQLRERWKRSSLRDFDEARGNELAKVDEVEREFWAAWQRSKEMRQTTHTKRKTGVAPSDEAGVKKEDSFGDPRFLDGVLKCVEKRCVLLGLNGPQKLALVDPTGKMSYGPFLTNEERLARLAEILDAGRIDGAGPTIN